MFRIKNHTLRSCRNGDLIKEVDGKAQALMMLQLFSCYRLAGTGRRFPLRRPDTAMKGADKSAVTHRNDDRFIIHGKHSCYRNPKLDFIPARPYTAMQQIRP